MELREDEELSKEKSVKKQSQSLITKNKNEETQKTWQRIKNEIKSTSEKYTGYYVKGPATFIITQ